MTTYGYVNRPYGPKELTAQYGQADVIANYRTAEVAGELVTLTHDVTFRAS